MTSCVFGRPAFNRLVELASFFTLYWLSLILTLEGDKNPQLFLLLLLCWQRFSKAVEGSQETNRKCYTPVTGEFPPMDEFQGKAICP